MERLTYLEHQYRALGSAFKDHPEFIPAVFQAMQDYVPNANYGTVAERREAMRTLANVIWTKILGHPYDGHKMKHYFDALTDVPEIEEPTTP